jgi:GNAT superfamily N-acetyltransferase
MLRVNNFLVFHLDLTKTKPAPPPPVGVTLRVGTVEDLRALRATRGDLPVEFYCDETHGFTTPFLAMVDGEVAAIHWLVFPGQRSRFLDMKPGDVELNYNTVLPQYRGRRLGQLLMAYLVDSAREGGHRRLFGVVHAANIAQFKPMLDMGFRPVEVVSHFAMSRPKATLEHVR